MIKSINMAKSSKKLEFYFERVINSTNLSAAPAVAMETSSLSQRAEVILMEAP
jgi:hypothetical protein